jgi:hypothetical protein
MWILPKQIISASALGMEALISDCEEFSQLAEQSLMWRSNPSQLRTWRQRWKRESWIKHLSGRILKHSMQNHFVAWWTSSLAATRVNRSVPQESETPKTQEDSGRFCADQFELFAPEECSSRTSKDTSRLDSPQSSAIWKKMVTEQRGEYSARLKSEQVTKERESSSWPTPDASVEKFRLGGNSQQSKSLEAMGRRGELSQQDPENRNSTGKNPEQWPTPRAGNPGSRKPGTGGKILEEEAKKIWPTPRASGQNDSARKLNKSGKRHAGDDLTTAAKNWATPEAQNHVGCQTRHGKTFPRLGTQTGGKLNPDWVEQLMGVPVSWTQLPIHWLTELIGSDCSETELSQPSQQKHGLN